MRDQSFQVLQAAQLTAALSTYRLVKLLQSLLQELIAVTCCMYRFGSQLQDLMILAASDLSTARVFQQLEKEAPSTGWEDGLYLGGWC